MPPELLALTPTTQIRYVSFDGDGVGKAGDYLEELRATIERQAEGYFTIHEAAQILSEATGSPAKKQIQKLRQAIEKETFAAYDQDDRMPVAGPDAVTNYASVLRVSDMVAAGFAFPNPPQTASVPNVTKTRRDSLTPVIELAQKQCSNSQDTAEVWGVLMTLANKQHPPLIRTEGNGIDYLFKDSVKTFTRDALNKRLHPEKRGVSR